MASPLLRGTPGQHHTSADAAPHASGDKGYQMLYHSGGVMVANLLMTITAFHRWDGVHYGATLQVEEG